LLLNLNLSLQAQTGFVNHGTIITVKCVEGFALDGPPSKTCDDGSFVPSEEWSCALICNPADLPKDVPFARVSTSGAEAVLKCADEYQLLVGGPGLLIIFVSF